MSEMMDRAVLLAAGKGTRMGAITEEIPKPLLPVRGKPLLEHIMDRLAEAGIRRFLIVVGFQGEQIERHFAKWKLPVEFRVQEPVNGTGSAAGLAKEFTGGEPFLLSFGDCLCSAASMFGVWRFCETIHPRPRCWRRRILQIHGSARRSMNKPAASRASLRSRRKVARQRAGAVRVSMDSVRRFSTIWRS